MSWLYSTLFVGFIVGLIGFASLTTKDPRK